MAKVVQLSNQKLSPKEYIKTKARNLPIEKCLINKGWQDGSMANIFVIRKHTNGNATIGLYLVDLLCLGVKNAAYFFNLSPAETEDLIERSSSLEHIEIDYILAHNIIYAGHDFAMEYEIHPHRDFEIAKYILEEDDDNIPLIDVEVGDENGMPFLIVKNKGQFLTALNNLKRIAGEGNYKYLIELDEDDFDEDDEELEDDFASHSLDEFADDMLLPFEATMIDWDDNDNIKQLEKRGMLDKITCSLELNRRVYKTLFPEKNISIQYMYEEDLIEMAINNLEDGDFTVENEETEKLYEKAAKIEDSETLKNLFLKHIENSKYVYLHIMVYEIGIISEDHDLKAQVKSIIKQKFLDTFSFKILFAIEALLNKNFEDEDVKRFCQTNIISDFFPNYEAEILPKDLLLFWLFKILQSCNDNNLEKGFYYYSAVISTFEKSPLLTIVQKELLTHSKDLIPAKIKKLQ